MNCSSCNRPISVSAFEKSLRKKLICPFSGAAVAHGLVGQAPCRC
jgi:hypothetical protein